MDNSKEVRFHLRFSHTKIQRRAAEILQTECGPREKTDFIARAILAYVGELPIRGQSIVNGGELPSNQQTLLQQLLFLQQALLRQLQIPNTDQLNSFFTTYANYLQSNIKNENLNTDSAKMEIRDSELEGKYATPDVDAARNLKQQNVEYISTDTVADTGINKEKENKVSTAINIENNELYEDSISNEKEANDEPDVTDEEMEHLKNMMHFFGRSKS